jgi:hypothetical protein
LNEDYSVTLAKAKGGKGGDSADLYHSELNESLAGGTGGAGGGADINPGGTVNPTGGGCGGSILPIADGCNGEVTISYEVP